MKETANRYAIALLSVIMVCLLAVPAMAGNLDELETRCWDNCLNGTITDGTVIVLCNMTGLPTVGNWTFTLPDGDVEIAYMHWHRWGACHGTDITAEFWNGTGAYESIGFPYPSEDPVVYEDYGVWFTEFSPRNGNHHYYWKVNASAGTNTFNATGCYETLNEHCDARWFIAVINNTDTGNRTHDGHWWHNTGYEKTDSSSVEQETWYYNASGNPINTAANYTLWTAQSHYGSSTPSIEFNGQSVGNVGSGCDGHGDGQYADYSLCKFNVLSTRIDTDGNQKVEWKYDNDAYYVNFGTLAEKISSQQVAHPDLIVASVSINPGCKHYYFANEPNVLDVTVKNIGTAAAGPSNASVSGASGTSVAPVGALNPGQSETVTITDPVARPAGEVVTATADCYGEVSESNEVNNTSSIIDPDGNNHVINHGLKGKWLAEGYAGPDPGNMTTWKSYELHGDLNYSIGDSTYLSDYSVAWDTYTANWTAGDLPISSGATVVDARLYVYYTWDKAFVMPDNVSMSFNGVNQDPYDVHYTDRRGYGTIASYNLPYGALVYNVTGDFNRMSNHAVLNKTIPSAPQQASMRGMMLVVVYEDPTEPLRQIFVIEEHDNLYSSASYCTTPEEATARALFTGPSIDIGTMVNANLITVAPGATNEGELLFNGQTWTDVWNFVGTTELGIDERDVTSYLGSTDNAVGFQSNGDWMEASNAFLVVEYSEQTGICGDVNCQDGVDMADAIQIAMGTIYGTEAYPLADPWAADVDCQDGVDMADAIQIAMSTIYGTGAYPLECCD